MTQPVPQPPTFADRLCEATNSHDVDRVVDCFTDDYLNETPAHPSRGFRGSEQVRRNWSHIFAAVPDIEAEIVSSSRTGETVWSEWEMRGTRADGAPHLMRGVVIFAVEGDRASAARFYLEPVEEHGVDADTAVRQTLAQPRR
jgi:ketosteroid isomerase-like protein